MCGCESWTLRKNEERRLDAFEMKGLRKILRVSWTAMKTNKKHLKNVGPIRHCEPSIDVHSDNNNNNNDNA